MKRIALLGGAFDPPHNGHSLIITNLLNSGLTDEVWLIPTGPREDKVVETAPRHRVEMVRLMVGASFPPDAPIRIETVQADGGLPGSRTIDLFEKFSKDRADAKFSVVIGGDLAKDLPAWKSPDKLQNIPFICIPRGRIATSPAPSGFQLTWLDAEFPISSISSTEIRKLIAENRYVGGHIVTAVHSYIRHHQLYGVRRKEDEPLILFRARFLQLMERGTWEYAERIHQKRVVVVMAVDSENNVIIAEQFRLPINNSALEFPAGLVEPDEAIEDAGRRELLEETGYAAGKMELLAVWPTSTGITSEIVHFFAARDLTKQGAGGGDEQEKITVHMIKLNNIKNWLEEKERSGLMIDPKIYSGLYLGGFR